MWNSVIVKMKPQIKVQVLKILFVASVYKSKSTLINNFNKKLTALSTNLNNLTNNILVIHDKENCIVLETSKIIK